MSEVLELIRNCEKAGVKMSVSGHNLKIDAPANLPDSVKNGLRRHKAGIIRTLAQNPSANISWTERLNRMITPGASFDVGADDFQTCGAECLTDSEKQFLATNKSAVLCTLQQALLMKYLSLGDLRMFKDEINERTAILNDGEETAPPFEVVAEVAREWFGDVLDEINETSF
jgi:hypothetical protein